MFLGVSSYTLDTLGNHLEAFSTNGNGMCCLDSEGGSSEYLTEFEMKLGSVLGERNLKFVGRKLL